MKLQIIQAGPGMDKGWIASHEEPNVQNGDSKWNYLATFAMVKFWDLCSISVYRFSIMLQLYDKHILNLVIMTSFYEIVNGYILFFVWSSAPIFTHAHFFFFLSFFFSFSLSGPFHLPGHPWNQVKISDLRGRRVAAARCYLGSTLRSSD